MHLLLCYINFDMSIIYMGYSKKWKMGNRIFLIDKWFTANWKVVCAKI